MAIGKGNPMTKTPSPGYSIIIRLEIPERPGMLGKVTSTIGKAGGDVGATVARDIIISVADIQMGQKVVDKLKRVNGIRVLNVTDRTFMIHQGGKIGLKNKIR